MTFERRRRRKSGVIFKVLSDRGQVEWSRGEMSLEEGEERERKMEESKS